MTSKKTIFSLSVLSLFLLMAGLVTPISTMRVNAQSVSVCDLTHCFYVSTTGSDTTGNGSVSAPYATITKAVSIAETTAPGNATVIVEPGTYNEMVLITQKLTLMSESGQPSNTIVNATGQPNGIIIAGSSAAGTIVEGFTVYGANNHGIYAQDTSGVIITNNVANGNGVDVIASLGEDKAIQLAGTSDSTVSGNVVVGNLYGGIGITDDGSLPPSWNSTAVPITGMPAPAPNPGDDDVISGNYIALNKPNHCAIVVSSYNPGEGVSNNVVSDNVVVNNQNGVIVAADTPNTIAINNTVINNNILNNGEGGVIVHSNAPGDVVTGNVINNNVISADGYLPTLEGVIIGGGDMSASAAVTNTTIVENTFENEAIGILIVNGNNTMVQGNIMGPTVSKAVNGTVTVITSAPSVSTVTLTTTFATTAIGTVTTTATTTTTSVPIWGYAAIAIALIVGVVAGFLISKPKK